MPRAVDLIENGESAICVFTHGDYLCINEGSTGYWKVNPGKVDKVDKVIVYHRDGGINRLYIGDYSHIVPAPANWPRRYTIFAIGELQEAGITNLNWLEFGNGGPNPAQIIIRN